ncbi:hypothetical protein DM02DRAFT_312839 [Periconia macrospinosa]|uniref:CHK kinase-like domain-containing protein n=1 Tax=Periconia macrospinosa TaxID=97972 RepID=A0A2V1DVN9_9PLEO|nr:hypothetical protein DM02DRAFT_312839 [Periconia macrospinosa]
MASASNAQTHAPDDVLELPTTPEDITAEWLSKALNQKVNSIKLDKTVPGTASKIFVTITYDPTVSSSPTKTTPPSPTKLCVKGGFDPTILSKMPWLVKIYQRECDFYNLVAPSLTHMGLPRCWWAGHNATQGILLMDDLASLSYDFGNPTETWSVARVLAGVEQLAALHARTWGVKETEYPWLTSDYDQAILTLMQTFDVVVNATDRPEIPGYLKDQERITKVLKKHYQMRNPRFRCLLHGDAHTANTYLVDGAPRLLDWQMIHLGSSFHDVAYFIGAALSIEDRRAQEWEVVEHYLSMLGKFGVQEKLSLDDTEVVDEYKKSFLSGVGWIMCPYEMQPREFVHPMAKRYAAALDDHKVLELVESIPDA